MLKQQPRKDAGLKDGTPWTSCHAYNRFEKREKRKKIVKTRAYNAHKKVFSYKVGVEVLLRRWRSQKNWKHFKVVGWQIFAGPANFKPRDSTAPLLRNRERRRNPSNSAAFADLSFSYHITKRLITPWQTGGCINVCTDKSQAYIWFISQCTTTPNYVIDSASLGHNAILLPDSKFCLY